MENGYSSIVPVTSLPRARHSCLLETQNRMSLSSFRRFAATSALLVPGIVFAQTSKGILAGVARDTTGAVVAGAAIKATNLDTHEERNTVSRDDGAFRLDALQPGRYSLTATQTGFATSQLDNVVVSPSIVTSADIAFTTGGATETVTVEAENSGINTENGQLAGVISPRQLEQLPIFSLNPVELALTVPGVQTVSQKSGFSEGINIEVNGARPRANNFLLDGQEINDVGIGGQAFTPQIPDIFQNETVITNNASAEYGRAGGAVVNLITKAGTNQFHGSGYERYNGSGLNAVDGKSRQLSGFQKARYDQHQYGFTLGGPIIKDKLFAFGGLFISRFYGSQTASQLELPDANGYAQIDAIAKAGNAQAALLEQYLSGGAYLTQFTYGAKAGVVTNVNVGTQNVCPTGCVVNTGFYKRPNTAANNTDTQWMYRVDFAPRAQDNFSFRYLHDRTNNSPDFGSNGFALPGFDTAVGGPSELGAGTWTHVFSPNIVNELRGSETRLGFAFAPIASTLANPLYLLPSFVIANVGQDENGNSAIGSDQNFPQGRSEELYQIQDTVSITRGRQTLRAGFDIGRQIETDVVSQNAKGTLTFAAGGTGVSALGNFLLNQLGSSGTATKTFGNTRVDPHGWRSGVFAQDDVKLNPDLTLNLGIRYDYLTNPQNSLKYPAIDPTNPYQAIDTVIKVQNDTNNIAPRIGFAYSPHREGLFGGGKTVVRGGFGVFYDSAFSNYVINSAQSAPNAVAGLQTSTAPDGLPNASTLIGTITPTLLPTSALSSGVVKNMVNPVTYQFNLGVERQLSGSNLLAVRYIGTIGKKLYANKQFNYFAPGGSRTRLNPTRGVINARGNFASSDYNAAQVEFTHNFLHGLQINSNYVFSKNLDNSSEIFITGAAPTSYQADLGPNAFAQEWGPSAYDHRHFFSVTAVWAPAGLHSSNAFADAGLGVLTRHWTLSGIEQLQSGSYSTFTNSGFDTNGDGSTTNDRPVLGNGHAPLATGAIDGGNLSRKTGAIPGVYYNIANALNDPSGKTVLNPVDPNSVHWLVPYQLNNQNLHQEIGRNSFSNPGTITSNIAVEKGIGASYLHLDRGRFVIRAEAQNIANHNDVGILDTNVKDIGSANFLNRSNARVATNPSGTNFPVPVGRSIVLWGKFVF